MDVWNVLTFCGHWAEEGLDPGAIDRPPDIFSDNCTSTDLGGLIYYLATLDHLILIPALWLFYLGLEGLSWPSQLKELAQR